jgi:hypothetical protein
MSVSPYQIRLKCPYIKYDTVPFDIPVLYDPADKKDYENRLPLTDHIDAFHPLRDGRTLSFKAPRSTPPTQKDASGKIIDFHPNPEWYIDLEPIIRKGNFPGIPAGASTELFVRKLTFRAKININPPYPTWFSFGSFVMGDQAGIPISPTESPFLGSLLYFEVFVSNPTTYVFTDDFYANGVLKGVFDLSGINLPVRYLGMTTTFIHFDYVDYDDIEIDIEYAKVM